MMQPGDLDRRISLRRQTTGKDAFGQVAAVGTSPATWAEIASVWASYKPVSDGEKWRSGQATADAVGWFVIRWRAAVADLSSQDALIFDGEFWSIQGVKPIGRREWLEITASRKGKGVTL